MFKINSKTACHILVTIIVLGALYYLSRRNVSGYKFDDGRKLTKSEVKSFVSDITKDDGFSQYFQPVTIRDLDTLNLPKPFLKTVAKEIKNAGIKVTYKSLKAMAALAMMGRLRDSGKLKRKSSPPPNYMLAYFMKNSGINKERAGRIMSKLMRSF